MGGHSIHQACLHLDILNSTSLDPIRVDWTKLALPRRASVLESYIQASLPEMILHSRQDRKSR